MGPFFVNTLLCILFCGAAFLPIGVLRVVDSLAYLFYWLGLSIGMHAFASTADLKNLWAIAPAKAQPGNVWALSLPLIGILYVLNLRGSFGPISGMALR